MAELETISIYLPQELAQDAQQLASRLDAPLSTLLWAAWEHAKPTVHASTPGVDDEGNPCSPLPAPPAQPPPELSVPGEAAAPGELALSGDKVALQVALPSRLVEELKALAGHGDRSMSFLLQKAYQTTRARLHGATRS